ncbi:M50 family metallopeptidase [Actinomycetospora sp. OC33-EN08]|uniref:M50 family metallopeptidase n=1 Tax=Actinomycetospora aurantiaca TaxID=3129233 RepID=A0ABU8MWA7_9PSEU
MDELIDVSIVGEPVVYGAGFIVLIAFLLIGEWAGSVVTVAHEGGHMIMSVLTLRGFEHFSMTDGDNAGTKAPTHWGVGYYLVSLAGYFTPPLLGLGAAAVLARGNAWAVLVGAVVLLAIAFVYAKGGLANLVTAIAAAVVVLVLWRGTPLLQAALAASVVWLLLLGGVRASVQMSRDTGSDAWRMQSSTFVPAVVWQAIWVTTALACLYTGGRLLFVGDAWPDGVWPFDEPA